MNQIAHTQAGHNDEPWYQVLAREAVLSGLTRERVITALQSRVRRDEGYLAYRRATGRRTSYDDQVKADLWALALAAAWLQETVVFPVGSTSSPPSSATSDYG